MSVAFTNNAHFDTCAAAAGWYYDNGWRYHDQAWDAYSGPRFAASDYLVLLKDGDRVVVLHYLGGTSNEIWTGRVATQEDFEGLLDELNTYLTHYKELHHPTPETEGT